MGRLRAVRARRRPTASARTREMSVRATAGPNLDTLMAARDVADAHSGQGATTRTGRPAVNASMSSTASR